MELEKCQLQLLEFVIIDLHPMIYFFQKTLKTESNKGLQVYFRVESIHNCP